MAGMKDLLDRVASLFGGKNAEASLKKGKEAFSSGAFDLAIKHLSETLAIDPTQQSAYCIRGMAYLAKGDDRKALGDFTQTLRMDPQNTKALWNRAVIYRKQGEDRKADADFAAAKKLDPRLVRETPSE